MNCRKCGTPLKEETTICEICGEKVKEENHQNDFKFVMSEATLEKEAESKMTMWIIVAIIVIAAIVITFMIFNKKECPKCDYNHKTTDITATSHKVKLNGYDVIIRDEYKYTVEGYTMYVSNKDDNWGLSLQIIEGTYETLIEKLEKMKENMTLDGYTIKLAEEKVINEHKYLVIEATKMNTNVLFALSSIPNTKSGISISEIYNINNNFDYQVLNDFEPTLNNIKYNYQILNVTIKDYDLTRFGLFTK